MTHTKESLAALLNGRQYDNEITKAEQAEAKASGLVVLFGWSDDLAEFRGAIHDEFSCIEGGVIPVHRGGPLADHESDCGCAFCGHEKALAKCAKIEAIWGKDGYSWTYFTQIPHATFEIMDGGDKYCRGIVFNLSELPEVGV
jgi:hypothetical protein